MYRKAEENDCQAVYNLICDMEGKRLPFARFQAIYQGQLIDDKHYCLVREEVTGGVVGVLNLRFEDQLHHADRIAEIMEFAIDSRSRNKGFGKDMFAKACTIARTAGCVQIEVACNQLRESTHRFYLREGMHNFHYKFSKPLMGTDSTCNELGR